MKKELTRRDAMLMSSTLGLGAVLTTASCSSSTTPPVTPPVTTVPAQVIADVTGILDTFYLPATATAPASGLLVGLSAMFPIPGIASIEQDIVTGEGLLAALSTAVSATSAATTLQTIENYINTALDALNSLSVIPAPYNLMVSAIVALLPTLEAFINSTLGAATVMAKLRTHLKVINMTPAQARAQLKIPTV